MAYPVSRVSPTVARPESTVQNHSRRFWLPPVPWHRSVRETKATRSEPSSLASEPCGACFRLPWLQPSPPPPAPPSALHRFPARCSAPQAAGSAATSCSASATTAYSPFAAPAPAPSGSCPLNAGVILQKRPCSRPPPAWSEPPHPSGASSGQHGQAGPLRTHPSGGSTRSNWRRRSAARRSTNVCRVAL